MPQLSSSASSPERYGRGKSLRNHVRTFGGAVDALCTVADYMKAARQQCIAIRNSNCLFLAVQCLTTLLHFAGRLRQPGAAAIDQGPQMETVG